MISRIVDLLPNVKLGDKIEIPIGPNLVLYYKVSGKVDIDSDIDVDLEIKEQRAEFKDFKISKSSDLYGGFNVSADVNSKGEYGASLKSGNSSVSINSEGKPALKSQKKVDNTTYTATLQTGIAGGLKYEEEVRTDIGSGYISSVIGIERTVDTRLKSLPEPITEFELAVSHIPQILSSHIEETVKIAVPVGLATAAVIFTICTGGAGTPVVAACVVAL